MTKEMQEMQENENETGILKIVELPISPRGGCGSACTININIDK